MSSTRELLRWIGRRRGIVLAVLAVGILGVAAPPTALAQGERYKGPIHYTWPPQPPVGSVGQYQLQRGFSPAALLYVRFAGPRGMEIAVTTADAAGATAQQTLVAPVTLALQVGDVYRVAVRDLPDHPGLVLYPTLEPTDSLRPPPGVSAQDFPISVWITEDMIAHVAQGRLVTDVFYLEDPDAVLPESSPGRGPLTEVGPGENPLRAADVFGRPMMIFRMGGRVPLGAGDMADFYGVPQLVPRTARVARPSVRR